MVLFTKVSLGQKDSGTVVEIMPEFTGGVSEMMKFFGANTRYPHVAKEAGIQGKCYLSFVVEPSGKIANAKIEKGISGCPECDREALRVISSMPDWKPGFQNGKAVPVLINVPFNFSLHNAYGGLEASSNNNRLVMYAPTFRGGPEEMTKFINKNKHYPKSLKDENIIGSSIVKFFVDSTGKVSNATIRQGSGYELFDIEAIRVVLSMPNWIPALDGTRRISRYCDLTIAFGNKEKLQAMKESKIELSNKNFKEGMESFQSDKLSSAKEKYKKAYILNCYHSDALYNLGVTYFRLNQKDSACYCWNELKVNFGRKEADELIKKYCSN